MKKIFLLALLLFTFLGFSQGAIITDPDGNPIEITPIDPDPIDPDPITTLSPISICPTNPDCPARIQCFPILVLPDTPACAEITVSSPSITLCAI